MSKSLALTEEQPLHLWLRNGTDEQIRVLDDRSGYLKPIPAPAYRVFLPTRESRVAFLIAAAEFIRELVDKTIERKPVRVFIVA